MSIVTVGLKCLDGVDLIIPVDVYHDMGNHGKLMWPLKLKFFNGQFGRFRSVGKQSGKPIYQEIPEEEYYKNG